MSARRSATLADIGDLILTLARTLQEPESRDPHIVRLSSLELLIVRHLRNHPGASPRSIGQAARMKSSNVAATLRSLESKNMIRRAPDPADGRGTLLYLTDEAQENIARVRTQTATLLDAATIDDGALTTTFATLQKMTERSADM